ncbi:hypothetical protein DPMN_132781 [Dreissena polymorpha]|uniref:Uncharacterized protein n=1 Tax=Dreissena polymorpha TaxID=45954 RepID=A0A9D4FVR6_DREPO|nr:hypothetical protein DPMN_132781 [Dreissena polymorpha]
MDAVTLNEKKREKRKLNWTKIETEVIAAAYIEQHALINGNFSSIYEPLEPQVVGGTNQPTNRPTNRQGKNNMSPTTISPPELSSEAKIRTTLTDGRTDGRTDRRTRGIP